MSRSPATIDAALSEAVKTRDAIRAQISELSAKVVAQTRTIDRLLAERAGRLTPPDSPAELLLPSA